MIKNGEFRADLFYRIKGVVLTIPPLRDRHRDVDLLIDHFIATSTRKLGKTVHLSESARDRLRSHPWPGNVRELKSTIEKVVSLAEGSGQVDEHALELGEIRQSVSLQEHVEEEERRRLISILESVNWNRSAAARTLKTKRTTLLGKLKRLGITSPKTS